MTFSADVGRLEMAGGGRHDAIRAESTTKGARRQITLNFGQGSLRGSGSLAVVVLEKAAEAFVALDGSSFLTKLGAGLENLVIQSLVISFGVIMGQEFVGCFS